MDEKEAVKRIRNSFEKGMSRAQIEKNLQNKGYKLEYIDALINKAKKPKKIFFILSLCLLILLSLATTTYSFLSLKPDLVNPIQGFSIYKEIQENSTNMEDIEITPEMISYLLNEIGAYKLHKNYITGEPSIISFKINQEDFYSEINKKIQTFQGIASEPDMIITTNKKAIINSLLNHSQNRIMQLIENKEISVEVIAGKTELISKGYLSLYETIK